MSVITPSGRYLRGAHKRVPWTDANETITTSNTLVAINISEVGITHGIAMLRRANDYANRYVVNFNEVAAKSWSVGGRNSATGSTDKGYSRELGDSELTDFAFDSSGLYIALIDIYVNTATNQVYTYWKSNSGNRTLNAQMAISLYKGSTVS